MNDEHIAGLADAIYREKVLRARGLSVGERIATGIELFEGALKVMRDGVRHQFPEADSKEVEEVLRKRMGRLKKLHEQDIYSMREVA